MKQSETAPAPPLTEALHIRASRPDDYEQIAAIMNLPGVRYGTAFRDGKFSDVVAMARIRKS